MSCEIGAVRLTETLPLLAGATVSSTWTTIEQAREIARKALAPIADFPKVGHAGVRRRHGHDDRGADSRRSVRKSIAFELSRSDLQRALVRLCALPLKERKKLAGMKPQRADILPAGIIVLETVLDLIGRGPRDRDHRRSAARASAPAARPGRTSRGRSQDGPAHGRSGRFTSTSRTSLPKSTGCSSTGTAGKLTPQDRLRLEDVQVQLDHYFDLLRQRRARRDAGQDPEVAHMRTADTVEHYQQ